MAFGAISSNNVLYFDEAAFILVKYIECCLDKCFSFFAHFPFDNVEKLIVGDVARSIAIEDIKHEVDLLIGYLHLVLSKGLEELRSIEVSRFIVIADFEHSLQADDSFRASLHDQSFEFLDQILDGLGIDGLLVDLALQESLLAEEHAHELLVVEGSASIRVALIEDLFHSFRVILETDFVHRLQKLAEFDMTQIVGVEKLEHLHKASLLRDFVGALLDKLVSQLSLKLLLE